jgi:predicted acylesterase/phospholipase RssA
MESKPQIALCLSGGGFRATFFHLGVIKLLRDFRILEKVTDVYSVSGGSILAAHMALHWDKYAMSSDESEFYEASSQLVEFGRIDLRNRLIRRSLLGWITPRFRRTKKLEFFYNNLLNHAELSSLPHEPRFYFLTTSMTTGALCANILETPTPLEFKVEGGEEMPNGCHA